MKTIYPISAFFVFAFILFACTNPTEQVDLTQTINVSNFDSIAGNYIEKQIIIKGTVSHVCKHGGKKMFIFEGDNDSVLVKLTSEKAFDVALEGSDVQIKGIVKARIITSADIEKMEQDAMNKPEEEQNPEHTEKHIEEVHNATMEQALELKEELKNSGKKQLEYYSVEVTELKEIK